VDWVFLHGRVATAAFLFALILGVWSLWGYLRGRGVNPNFWGALVIGEGLMVAQAVIGLVLYLQGGQPADGSFIHILYGVVALIAWPAAYFFTHGNDTRRESLVYALVSLFLVGATLRGIMTGYGAFRL
jgi:hypothetical protein